MLGNRPRVPNNGWMTVRGTVAIAGILLAALALAGCVTVVEPPKAGLTDAEAQSIVHENLDQFWTNTGLSDEQLRPEITPIALLSSAEATSAFITCMNEAGYSQYSTAYGGGYSVADHPIDTKEKLALYRCNARYQMDPREYRLNRAQLEYLYDYYQTTLIPCLARAGFVDLEQVATREQMLQYGGWNPYYSLPADTYAALTSESEVVRMCPATPVGSGFEMQWASQR